MKKAPAATTTKDPKATQPKFHIINIIGYCVRTRSR